jgi:outer membrane protein
MIALASPVRCVVVRLLFIAAMLSSETARTEPLTFDEAVALARENTRDAVRAREDLLLVDVQHKAALAAILPRFDVTLAAGEAIAGSPIIETRTPARPGEVGPFVDFEVGSFANPSFTLQVTGQQLIYDGGRWWTVIARVSDIESSRKAAQHMIENDLRARVAERFYGLEIARQATRVVRDRIQVQEAQLDRARRLLEAGRGKQNDVATAVRNLAEDRIELVRKKQAEEQAVRALNLEMGVAPETPIALSIDREITTASTAIDLPSLPDTGALVKAAIERRPELDSIRAEIRGSEKSVTIARADLYPAVTLGASYRRVSRRPDRVIADPTRNFYAGLDLTMRWNLFEGRAADARIEEEEIKLRKLLADRRDLERRIAAEVQDKLQNLEAQGAVLELAQEAVRAATEAVRLARGLYDQGLATALERRDAELKYTQAELSAITARLELEIAREGLVRALGASLEEAARAVE